MGIFLNQNDAFDGSHFEISPYHLLNGGGIQKKPVCLVLSTGQLIVGWETQYGEGNKETDDGI